ncbi:MAG: hypothetical protein P1V35_17000 [Planctomycetota bacterium]|nr:hypothetical protein [Planctomycetota bacterium]
MRWALVLGTLCFSPSWAWALETIAQDQVVQEPGDFAGPNQGYHGREAVRELLAGWVSTGGDNVRWVESFGGVPAIEFGAGDVNRRPLVQRRTVLLIGGLDGRSVAGGESVLHAGHRLLSGLDTLRPDLAFLLVPWASPEGLEQVDRGRVESGRDLDGDGLVLEMLVEDPQGAWTPSLDARFLCAAQDGDAPRYNRLAEGAGLQGDARVVDLDAAFPLLTSGGETRRSAGMDQAPVIQELMRYVLERPCALVVSFQGNHGGLAFPGAAAQPSWGTLPDAGLYGNLGRAFQNITKRPGAPVQSLWQARAGEERGSFVDWCYSVPGVVAFEVAPWGMGLKEVDLEGLDRDRMRGAWDFRREPDGRGAHWAHWLDEARGGMGFAEWRPVVTPDGEKCLVGGWKPRTYWNPPEDELAGALEGLPDFVEQLVGQLPYLELCEVSVVREGELCTVTARLRCVGAIPMQPQVFGRWSGSGVKGSAWVRMESPQTVERIAGPREQIFPRLESGGRTQEVRWLLFAPEGARMDVRFGLGETELGHKELVL